MLEVLFSFQLAGWVKVPSLLLLFLAANSSLIRLNQVLEAVLKQVKEPTQHVVGGFEAPDKLGIAPFLFIKDFPVLELTEVHVVLEVVPCDSSLFSLDHGVDKESDYTEKTVLLLKELYVSLCKVPLEPLH